MLRPRWIAGQLQAEGIANLVRHKPRASGRRATRGASERSGVHASGSAGPFGCDLGFGAKPVVPTDLYDNLSCNLELSNYLHRPQRGLLCVFGPLGRAFLIPRPMAVVDYF